MHNRWSLRARCGPPHRKKGKRFENGGLALQLLQCAAQCLADKDVIVDQQNLHRGVPLAGILGQEDQDAGLAATSLGQIVGFDERMLAEVGHGVKIEIERLPGEQVCGNLGVP